MSRKQYKRIISIMMLMILILQGIVLGTSEENPYIEQNLQYQSIDENGNLKIYSEAAILIEQSTGEILYEKNAYEKKYPASTTKILTAILAIEKCDLQEVATASESAIFSVKSGYTTADIQVGESFTIERLLEVMMLQSANEAANIIAEYISGSVQEFANLMNQKALEIGCQNTHFVNANGAHDDNHYSTAYDMALIANYCMKNQKFKEISSKMECNLPITDKWQEERKFKNTNSLMINSHRYYYPYCTGIKTGFTTPAKNCLVASSNKEGYELISVVLHAEATEDSLSARYLDTISLFNYGYKNFALEDIQEEYDLIGYVENPDIQQINNFDVELKQEEIDLKEAATSIKTNYTKKKMVWGILVSCIIIGGMVLLKTRKKVYRGKRTYSRLYHFKYDI